MKGIALVGAVVLCALLLFILWLAIGPAVDNRVGLISGRDIALLRAYRVEGATVESFVHRGYRDPHWTGRHVDEMFRTLVECVATRPDGKQVALRWEVAHDYSPHPAIAPADIFVCAMNREAAELTPSLAPPGMAPDDYPSQPRVYSMALYGEASKNWVNGDPKVIKEAR